MTKSELIARIAELNPHLYQSDAEKIVSTVFDEIGAALFACGATEVSLRLKKEPEGLRLLVQSDYTAENRPKLERLSKLLQPEIRDPALAETFWELAGADLAHDTSELALVGQILDGAHVAIEDAGVSMDLFVAR